MDEIRLEGLEALEKNIDIHNKEMTKAMMKGLKKVGLKIIADAQRNLRANNTNNTGMLSQSGKVLNKKTYIEIGFYGDENSAESGAGYAWYVEFGRRQGKMPPVKILQQWAKKKLGLSDKEAKPVGFLVARKIGKQGTRPQPFFVPALKKNESELEKALKEAAAPVINKE